MTSIARFQVDPRLAKLLGEGYRSTEKALKELVDNAWDADAQNVWVTIPDDFTSDPILFADDGAGMTEAEVRNEYLSIANDRRSRKGDKTPGKQRAVKGRKGIGKFAGLMAAEVMEVETRSRGRVTRLTIPKSQLLSAGTNLERIDLDIRLEDCDLSDHGTTISLSALDQNYALPSVEYFKRILILEYGRSEDFRIYVNGSPLGISDLPGTEFADTAEIEGVGPVRLQFKVSDTKQGLKQSGIAIRVGGKIVGDPIYFGLDEDQEIPPKLLRKVYGEIDADGLLDDVTADWGAVVTNSLRFQAIEPWVRDRLKEGVESVYKHEVEQTRSRLNRQIQQRLKRLPENRRLYAEAALQRVMKKFYNDSIEKIETVASVVLDALEQDEYFLVLQQIDEAKRSDVQALAEALEAFGLVDFILIGQQAQSRLRFLEELEYLVVNSATLEKQVHQAIERNLWILGPEYALMASNVTTARAIKEYADQKFSGPRASRRPDLLLANGLHHDYLLIEFKRPSHVLNRDDEAQAKKYRDDLTPTFGKMSIILLGKKRDPQIPAHYDEEDIRFSSYLDVISIARRRLDWLLKEGGAS